MLSVKVSTSPVDRYTTTMDLVDGDLKHELSVRLFR